MLLQRTVLVEHAADVILRYYVKKTVFVEGCYKYDDIFFLGLASPSAIEQVHLHMSIASNLLPKIPAMAKSIKVGSYLFTRLKQLGIDTVFGVPGGTEVHLVFPNIVTYSQDIQIISLFFSI